LRIIGAAVLTLKYRVKELFAVTAGIQL